jgi:hypothetical protein
MLRITKLIMLVVVCTLALAITVPAALAGNPPTGAERVIGPPIEGVFVGHEVWVVDSIWGEIQYVIGTIVGACKNNQEGKVPVIFYIEEPADVATLTEEDLMNYREGLTGMGPAGCFSDGGGENLIVTGVQKFINYSSPGVPSVIGAEVQLSVVEAKTTGN